MQIRSCAVQENVADLLQIAGEEGALRYDLIEDILTIWGVPLDLDYALRSDAAGVRKLALFFAVAKESPQVGRTSVMIFEEQHVAFTYSRDKRSFERATLPALLGEAHKQWEAMAKLKGFPKASVTSNPFPKDSNTSGVYIMVLALPADRQALEALLHEAVRKASSRSGAVDGAEPAGDDASASTSTTAQTAASLAQRIGAALRASFPSLLPQERAPPPAGARSGSPSALGRGQPLSAAGSSIAVALRQSVAGGLLSVRFADKACGYASNLAYLQVMDALSANQRRDSGRFLCPLDNLAILRKVGGAGVRVFEDLVQQVYRTGAGDDSSICYLARPRSADRHLQPFAPDAITAALRFVEYTIADCLALCEAIGEQAPELPEHWAGRFAASARAALPDNWLQTWYKVLVVEPSSVELSKAARPPAGVTLPLETVGAVRQHFRALGLATSASIFQGSFNLAGMAFAPQAPSSNMLFGFGQTSGGAPGLSDLSGLGIAQPAGGAGMQGLAGLGVTWSSGGASLPGLAALGHALSSGVAGVPDLQLLAGLGIAQPAGGAGLQGLPGLGIARAAGGASPPGLAGLGHALAGLGHALPSGVAGVPDVQLSAGWAGAAVQAPGVHTGFNANAAAAAIGGASTSGATSGSSAAGGASSAGGAGSSSATPISGSDAAGVGTGGSAGGNASSEATRLGVPGPGAGGAVNSTSGASGSNGAQHVSTHHTSISIQNADVKDVSVVVGHADGTAARSTVQAGSKRVGDALSADGE